jgi:hypothetical protein
MRLQRVGEGMSPTPLWRFPSTGHGVRPHRKPVSDTLFLCAAYAAVDPTQKHYGEHLPVSRRVARINGSVAAPTDGAGLGGA